MLEWPRLCNGNMIRHCLCLTRFIKHNIIINNVLSMVVFNSFSERIAVISGARRSENKNPLSHHSLIISLLDFSNISLNILSCYKQKFVLSITHNLNLFFYSFCGSKQKGFTLTCRTCLKRYILPK